MLEHSQTINSGMARPMFLVLREEKACEIKIDCNKNGLLKIEIDLKRRNPVSSIVFFFHITNSILTFWELPVIILCMFYKLIFACVIMAISRFLWMFAKKS